MPLAYTRDIEPPKAPKKGLATRASSRQISDMLKEFKKFAMRGNVVDLAVGVIIGGAFGKVVSSLVSDLIMPPIGLLAGRMDFSNLFLSLTGRHFSTLAEARAAAAPTLNIGLFLNALLDFLIIAFAVFMLVRLVNRLDNKGSQAATRECPYCTLTISSAAKRCPHCTSELSIGEAVVR